MDGRRRKASDEGDGAISNSTDDSGFFSFGILCTHTHTVKKKKTYLFRWIMLNALSK
jgi:hypothetical protein